MTEVSSAMKTEGRTPHPRKNDPLEQAIRQKITTQAYSTERGRAMFAQVDGIQVDYFKDALNNLTSPNIIHDGTQKVLTDIAKATHSEIVEGKEVLDSLPKESPIMIVANHYGGFKLVMIEQSRLGLSLGTDKIDDIPPFPSYFAAFKPAADALGDNLYDAHLELPGPLLTIQEDAGLLVVPEDNGAFPEIKRRTQGIISAHENSMLVIFPEAGTSGKRNNGGPYDLDAFHGGSFAIAEELGIPIVPMGQFFNPNKGFEIKVFEPVSLKDAPGVDNMEVRRAYFAQVAIETRAKMQAWFDVKKAA